ncbi:MAG: Crp/Fnr family transcriptional regulator [Crocinitomicaceae bacterium]
MNELEQYIASYFGVVNAEDLQIIGALFKETSYEKGDMLLMEGKKCDQLSFVQSGYVRMFHFHEDREITQWISSKGHFTTDLTSFIYEKPSRLTIQALSDSIVYSISKSDYLKIGELVSQWHELEKMFIIKCFITLEERVYSHLAMTAEERYQYFFENNKELFNHVPLQYIASLLGMSPETFSRIRKKL